MQDFAKLEERVAALMQGTYTLSRWDGVTAIYRSEQGAEVTIRQPKGTLRQTLSAAELMQMATIKVVV